MSDHVTQAEQRKKPPRKPLFKPAKTLFMFVQNKNYNLLRQHEAFQHVSDLDTTDEDIKVMKGIAKKLGAKDDDIIHILDANRSTFKQEMNAAEAWILEGETLGENRCLFFYYTGHGFQQNWTQAGLNDAKCIRYEMELKLNAISRNNNCFVVAIFDCCREDISAKVKGDKEP